MTYRASWRDERRLRRPQKKFVEALGRGMGKSEATCTFSVILSSRSQPAVSARARFGTYPRVRPELT
jgi:hypothetical protein